ncbi:conserved hypothetical protein [Neospora caninum Liverpool]|uniref:Ig-like domain-containing protein n=1 Tax=Neospora caninum (strain Liverpool) TaxID=572307 RepID=F0V9A7_NEOCL|nr:conserved hypothetical protein [Neospora caninum Liverpool]CBZ50332.1 conserved hypothetical protein [Neospora caninum Liverpool]CEL64938.1 TPA: hypothetical protein BN1204_008050 [Neospora caninum Liverpool]|eukprot:XP_003880366.1 conserved hypothetical protein [Neospora caninum Liverpool]
MQTSLECTKSIVRQQQTELEWLIKQRDVANRVIAHLRTELDLTKREINEAKHKCVVRNHLVQEPSTVSATGRTSSVGNSSELSKQLRSRSGLWRQIDEIKERNRQLTKETCDLTETVSHLKRLIGEKAEVEQRQSEVRSCCRLPDIAEAVQSCPLF